MMNDEYLSARRRCLTFDEVVKSSSSMFSVVKLESWLDVNSILAF